jgi:diguanylate cyclase (GGDEF)-like protein/PAS domain S-box-containing protein
VEAATQIHKQYDVPVIFCTAYSNEETLERAKISEPYGYVLKPFDNRELEINIEIALYKHRVETDLADTRQRLDATLTHVNDGVIAADGEGQIYVFNPMAEKITGCRLKDARHSTLSKILPLQAFESGQAAIELNNWDNFNCWEDTSGVRQYLIRQDGQKVPIEISVNSLKDSKSNLMVITFRDISQQLSYEATIQKNAFFDNLTELPNRSLFIDRLEGSLNRRKRGRPQQFAVLFMDIDGFGAINENLGHERGDRLIHEVGSRIDKTSRPDDTVSRFSSDIFAVLLDPVDAANGAILACQRILDEVEKPVTIDGAPVSVTVSVGIVLNHGNYKNSEEVIRDANTALQRAKLDAQGSYILFDKEMHRDVKKFLERKKSMQQAILDGAFDVHYQPIVDVESASLTGMEALVRWPHPIEGMVSPEEFIPIAEETGLILQLGEWVLRSVCKQIKQWNCAGMNNFRVAVNLSARQFENNIPSLVSEILDETEISADSLGLEITEGVAMKDVDHNIRMLEELKDLGISISIDDFGTGYSSLAYLKRFPLNTLKIDRSFIKDIAYSTDDREITKAIIAMGQNLNLKVLAEGVETEDQLEILRHSGCDYIQRYYYSRPMPAADVLPFLQDRNLVNAENMKLMEPGLDPVGVAL